jgi:hypothetical protein
MFEIRGFELASHFIFVDAESVMHMCGRSLARIKTSVIADVHGRVLEIGIEGDGQVGRKVQGVVVQMTTETLFPLETGYFVGQIGDPSWGTSRRWRERCVGVFHSASARAVLQEMHQ